MSAMSSALEVLLIDWLRANPMPAAPASLEVALYTTDPMDDNSGTEVAAGLGYARQPIVLTAPASVVGVGSDCTNTADILFGPCVVGPWGSITHWAIYEVGGGALFLLHGSFVAAKAIIVGDSYSIPAGTLNLLAR